MSSLPSLGAADEALNNAPPSERHETGEVSAAVNESANTVGEEREVVSAAKEALNNAPPLERHETGEVSAAVNESANTVGEEREAVSAAKEALNNASALERQETEEVSAAMNESANTVGEEIEAVPAAKEFIEDQAPVLENQEAGFAVAMGNPMINISWEAFNNAPALERQETEEVSSDESANTVDEEREAVPAAKEVIVPNEENTGLHSMAGPPEEKGNATIVIKKEKFDISIVKKEPISEEESAVTNFAAFNTATYASASGSRDYHNILLKEEELDLSLVKVEPLSEGEEVYDEEMPLAEDMAMEEECPEDILEWVIDVEGPKQTGELEDANEAGPSVPSQARPDVPLMPLRVKFLGMSYDLTFRINGGTLWYCAKCHSCGSLMLNDEGTEVTQIFPERSSPCQKKARPRRPWFMLSEVSRYTVPLPDHIVTYIRDL